MKALPVWQPWATLVAAGAKRIETRDYPPNRLGLVHGQRIAIYATKGLGDPRQGGLTDEEFRQICRTSPFLTALADAGYHGPAELPRGKIVATVTLDRATYITETSIADLRSRRPVEHAFGLYEPGRWAWVLEDLERLAEPAPARGSQGTFDWHPDGQPAGKAQLELQL